MPRPHGGVRLHVPAERLWPLVVSLGTAELGVPIAAYSAVVPNDPQ